MRSRLIVCAAILLATAGCSAASKAPPPPALTRLYASNFVTSGTGLQIFAPPFSAAEAASVSVPASGASGLNDAGGIAIDSTGRLYAINDGATPSVITIYAQPLSAASTPTITFALPASTNAYGLVLDPSGNLWVSDRHGATSHVYEYTPPFSNASTPALTLTPATNGLNDASGMAFDGAGHFAVTGEASSNIVIYTTPVTVASTPAATFALNAPGQGVVFDSSGRLFAVNESAAIQVFVAPFSNASTESFHFALTSGFCIAPAFDSSGNLWIDNSGGPNVQEFTPPFSASTTAALTMTSGFTNNYGLAFGP